MSTPLTSNELNFTKYPGRFVVHRETRLSYYPSNLSDFRLEIAIANLKRAFNYGIERFGKAKGKDDLETPEGRISGDGVELFDEGFGPDGYEGNTEIVQPGKVRILKVQNRGRVSARTRAVGARR